MTNFPKIPQTVSDRNTNRQTMISIETNAVQKLLGCGDSGESAHFPAQNSLTPSIVQETPCCSPEKATANDCASESSEHALDADERLARSRDRNREHARRTRLRKKQQLEALQKRVKELQEESRLLKQTIEECSIASILLGLSSGDASGSDDDFDFQDIESIMSSSAQDKTFFTITGKRKRFVSDADLYLPPMKLKIKGKLTMIGGNNCKAQINWKTGVYHDEDGKQQQLTHDELEELRRERNRMHAKMTRDRKKLFVSSVEKTIADLEEQNKRMRDLLAKQALRHAACVTPDLAPVSSDLDNVPCITSEVQSPAKKQKRSVVVDCMDEENIAQ